MISKFPTSFSVLKRTLARTRRRLLNQSLGPGRFLVAILTEANATGDFSRAGKALRRWADKLEGSDWPIVVERFLDSIDDAAFARALVDEVLLEGDLLTGGRQAVASILAAATGDARLIVSVRAQAEDLPQMRNRLVKRALRMGPHSHDGSPSRWSHWAAPRNLAPLAIISDKSSVSDVRRWFPAAPDLVVSGYRSSVATLDRWAMEAQADATQGVTILDGLHADTDLYDESHKALSADADRLAGKVLADPALQDILALNGFGERHRETAVMSLSDRFFAWFRVQAGLVKLIERRRPRVALLVGLSRDIRPLVVDALNRIEPDCEIFVVEDRDSLRSERAAAPDPDDCDLFIDPTPLLATIAQLQARATGSAGSKICGWAAWSGERLYRGITENVVAVLRQSVDVIHVSPEVFTRSQRLIVRCGRQRVRVWLDTDREVQERLEKALKVSQPVLQDQAAWIVSTHLAADLSGLVLNHVAFERRIARERPDFAIINPSRAPLLRVLARDLMAAGVPVHEIQSVYMTRMPRYRAPVASYFHALDTHSRDDLLATFTLDGQVVVAGSVEHPRLSGNRDVSGSLTVVVATQPLPLEQMLTMVADTSHALRAMDRPFRLMLRPHPAEGDARRERYRNVVGDLDIAFVGAETALNEAHVLVTGFSNLAAHAAALDVRTVLFWPASDRTPVPFEKMGLAVRAHDRQSLTWILEDFSLDGPKARALDASRRTYLEGNPFLGGGAAQTVAASVLESVAERAVSGERLSAPSHLQSGAASRLRRR